MDSLISAAARALAAGDALAALQRVALRDDPPALALRGIAMAQLGEPPRARDLLRRAARGFGTHEPVARARCVVAEAEVALAQRDLGGRAQALMSAGATLQAHGDIANALQARLVAARTLILLGKLDEASAALAGTPTTDATTRLPPSLVAVAELAAAELALRSLHIGAARTALQRAQQAAAQSGVPALLTEVAQAHALLEQPAARCLANGVEHTLRLDDVAALLASPTLWVVDACRHGVRAGEGWHPLGPRPAGRRGPRSLDRQRVPHPPPRRNPPRPPAGGNRPPARPHRSAGRGGGHAARLCAPAPRRTHCGRAGPTGGGRAGRAGGAAGRRCGMVHIRPGAGPGRQPAPRAACAG